MIPQDVREKCFKLRLIQKEKVGSVQKSLNLLTHNAMITRIRYFFSYGFSILSCNTSISMLQTGPNAVQVNDSEAWIQDLNKFEKKTRKFQRKKYAFLSHFHLFQVLGEVTVFLDKKPGLSFHKHWLGCRCEIELRS